MVVARSVSSPVYARNEYLAKGTSFAVDVREAAPRFGSGRSQVSGWQPCSPKRGLPDGRDSWSPQVLQELQLQLSYVDAGKQTRQTPVQMAPTLHVVGD